MPSSAMKPTEAGTDRYSPAALSAAMPPTSANGMLAMTSSACLGERKVSTSSTKMAPSASGTTSASRAAARCWFSNWPPQTMRMSLRPASLATAAWASRTKLARSRPSTLTCTTAKRAPFSWSTRTGPSRAASVAREVNGQLLPSAAVTSRPARPSGDWRSAAPPRRMSGVRATPSGTMPMRSPSTRARSCACRPSPLSPDWPSAARLSATCRYCTPLLLGAMTSEAPATARMRAATAWAAVSSRARSGSKILMATSPRVPVSISETRISMGWVKP